MPASRSRASLLTVTRLAAWVAGGLTVLAGLLAEGPAAARLPAIAGAVALAALFGAWAMNLSRQLPFSFPALEGRRYSRLGSRLRTLAGPAARLPWQSEEAERAETRVRLALRSGAFFREVFAGYLGSLVQGRPLDEISFWSRESVAARDGRRALEETTGFAPGTSRRRPSPHELEELLRKVEEAYERGRRLPGQ